MKKAFLFIITTTLLLACNQPNKGIEVVSNDITIKHTRHLHDTIGFAQYAWQLDSIVNRIDASDKQVTGTTFKAAISPHDDYAYAGGLYHKTLQNIKAKIVILVGVAHRARNFNLQDKIIFGSFTEWDCANGPIQVSSLRDSLVAHLKKETFIVHDSMMELEHSLEAITPFLQKFNPEVEIVPLLVPYMKYSDMELFSEDLATVLASEMKKQKLSFGEDVAIVISNDAIHYGTTGWGGKDLAPFGVDREGNQQAHDKDMKIIVECLVGTVSSERVKTFTEYTVMPADYKEYNWTWCGRYATPFGLLTANKLNQKLHGETLSGTLMGYRSSIKDPHIQVEDIGMGHTAPALPTHWVAYVGMRYN
jgi:AmmeMemoRadiSam system protein B